MLTGNIFFEVTFRVTTFNFRTQSKNKFKNVFEYDVQYHN